MLAAAEADDAEFAASVAAETTIAKGTKGAADAERCRPAVIAAIGRHGMATCAARIRGGWEHDRIDRGRFGITLHLSPELPDESTPN